jgi:hypothetical protein
MVDAMIKPLKANQMKKYMLLILAGCLLSGCLKNDNYKDFSGISPLITNPNTNYPAASIFAPAIIDSSYGVAKLNLIARYAFGKTAPKPIRVTFVRNDSLSAVYNQRQFIKYLPLPESSYQSDGLVLTIPAGAQQATLPITIFPQKISGMSKYIIAFTIKDAEGIVVGSTTKSIVFTLKGQ